MSAKTTAERDTIVDLATDLLAKLFDGQATGKVAYRL
jgi:hypothetical protein